MNYYIRNGNYIQCMFHIEDATPITKEEFEAVMTKAEREIEHAQPTPTDTDRIEAQVMYTALMTDTLLESEV